MKDHKIGEIIKYLRKENGFTQVELAKRSNISNVAISEIENGVTKMPDLKTVKKIANALNMEWADLLEYKIIPKTQEDKTNYIEDIDRSIRLEIKSEDAILTWALQPENMPYLEFIYKYAKDISVVDLQKVRLYKDIT